VGLNTKTFATGGRGTRLATDDLEGAIEDAPAMAATLDAMGQAGCTARVRAW
jgi:hypothetical protein